MLRSFEGITTYDKLVIPLNTPVPSRRQARAALDVVERVFNATGPWRDEAPAMADAFDVLFRFVNTR